MKKIFFSLLILTTVIFTGCRSDEPYDEPNGEEEHENLFPAEIDKEYDDGSPVVFPELNSQLIADLELLCKIWGFLKYHHPEVGKGNYNWDYELFRMLPAYLQVNNTEERDRALLAWINRYGAIPVCTTCRETPSDAYIKPNLLWAENSNMNQALKEKIREIYQNRHQGEHYYVQMVDGVYNPLFLHENLYNFYYPDDGFRLLALFRYWNMIHYFFPYKYLTDNNWDDIIPEYIPLFVSASNRLEYELAALQLTCEINDTHASFGGGTAIAQSRGAYYAPFHVLFIEGKWVVTYYFNPELAELSDIKIGDVITHINGEAVESIIENRKKYYPASNRAVQLWKMSFDLLRSTQNTMNIQSEQRGQITLQLYTTNYLPNFVYAYNGYVNKNEKCYKLLDGNIGYITLASIKFEDVTEIRNAISDTKGLIIDIRNYPNSSAIFSLLSYFYSSNTPYATFTRGNPDNPGEFTFYSSNYASYYGETYQGKLIVIVNEHAISHAEFTAMALRAGVNTTIIGSSTAGADGNVSSIYLPGGLRTRISGIGVYYPDGTGTQRVGIVPDVWVEPTIEAIRQGRDEPLEMAIHLINEEL